MMMNGQSSHSHTRRDLIVNNLPKLNVYISRLFARRVKKNFYRTVLCNLYEYISRFHNYIIARGRWQKLNAIS